MSQELNTTEFWPKVLQVYPTDDYCVYAYFNDGSVRLFNVAHLIKPGTVFEPLLDIDCFKSTLTVMNDTIAWDLEGNHNSSTCIDIDPFVVFEQPAVADPLEIRIAY